MLTGSPSTLTCISVPWSQSKPLKKICSALPPPACCATKRPGTTRINSCVFLTGCRSRSIFARLLNFCCRLLLSSTTSLRFTVPGCSAIVIFFFDETFVPVVSKPINEATSFGLSLVTLRAKLPS